MSESEQKAPAYYEVTASYVDTCYPDYLQDGHTREGEWLLSAPLGGQTDEEAVDELVAQMNGEAPPEGFPGEDELSDERIRTALLDVVCSVDFRPLDEDGNELDAPDEDDEEGRAAYDEALEGEQPYVYVVLQWRRLDDSELDHCEECETAIPPDAETVEGPWHGDACSLNIKNSVG